MEFRIISRSAAIIVLIATLVGGFLEYKGLEIGLVMFPCASLGALACLYFVSARLIMQGDAHFDPQVAAAATQQYANASIFLVGILVTGGICYHIANFGLDTELWISKGKIIWLMLVPLAEGCVTAYISPIISGEIWQLDIAMERERSSPVAISMSPMPDTSELLRSVEEMKEAMALAAAAMSSAATEARRVKDGMAEVNGALTEIGALKDVASGLRAIMLEFSGFFGEGR